MLIYHRQLQGMKVVFLPYTFDGANGLSIDLRHKKDTRIQWFHRILINHDHRTGTTIAFVTAFLSSTKTTLFTQKFKTGQMVVYLIQPDNLSVEKKSYIHDNQTALLEAHLLRILDAV